MTEIKAAPVGPDRPSRWRRPGLWIGLAVLAFTIWLLASLAVAGWHAQQTRSSVATMTDALRAGNQTVSAAAIEDARSKAGATRSALTSLPITVLNVVPYFHTNLTGAKAILGTTQEVIEAAAATNDLYPALMGDGRQTMVKNGAIDVQLLQDVAPDVARASQHLTAAERYLNEVPAKVSPALRDMVDSTAPDVHRLAKALRTLDGVIPELPTLLGSKKPATYLVVFHNPGELYAGGGAALNMALVQFDNGQMKVIDRGDVAHFFPLAQRVPWDPVAGGPYYADRGARDGFAWSNLHQDFRVAGEDMMRSWKANGGPHVDGIISLDPIALQAAVAATGPIESALYGRITADNLVQKLLVDAYAEADQTKRHEMNQQLIDEMLTRMQHGDAALSVARAVLATAPGQHVRIRLSNDRLAKALHEASLDGAQPDPEPDRIAFYTQNQNASKVDVFQKRSLRHVVRLASDGSADVEQTARITNDVPTAGRSSERTGYLTGWAFHWNIVFLPEGASNVHISANKGDVRKDPRVFTDVDGRTAVRIGRWIPPGGTSVVRVSYSLPAGTFGSDGNLDYRVGVEHQLTLHETDLTVKVIGPSQPTPTAGDWQVQGNEATSRFPVTQPTVLALHFGG